MAGFYVLWQFFQSEHPYNFKAGVKKSMQILIYSDP